MVRKLTFSLTTVLALLVVVIMVNLLTPTVGARRTGRSPFSATMVTDNKAVGSLAYSEEGWHQFLYNGDPNNPHPLDISLGLIPNSTDQIQFVTLDVFSLDQLERWYLQEGSLGQVFGFTTVSPYGNDPNVSKLLWNGQITPQQVYYVRVSNELDQTINYELYFSEEGLQSVGIVNVIEAPSSVESAAPPPAVDAPPPPVEAAVENAAPAPPPPVEAAVENAVPAPPPPIEIPAGTDPNNPLVMDFTPWQANLSEGRLSAQADRWFSVSATEAGGEANNRLDLSLFFTPGDGPGLSMDIFPGIYPEHWSRGEGDRISNLGTGRWVSRDGDDRTGELIWNGSIYNTEIFYVRLRNHNPSDVDYWLFTGDIANVVLDEPAPAPAQEVAPEIPAGSDFNHAATLLEGLDQGSLTAGEDHWVTVSRSSIDTGQQEMLKLSVYFAPNDGSDKYQVYMDLFDAGQNPIWSSWNDVDLARNFDVGTIVARDQNLNTVELPWANDIYYVRLRNVSVGPIDYWLLSGDTTPPQ